jgi:hypothetical protein
MEFHNGVNVGYNENDAFIIGRLDERFIADAVLEKIEKICEEYHLQYKNALDRIRNSTLGFSFFTSQKLLKDLSEYLKPECKVFYYANPYNKKEIIEGKIISYRNEEEGSIYGIRGEIMSFSVRSMAGCLGTFYYNENDGWIGNKLFLSFSEIKSDQKALNLTV